MTETQTALFVIFVLAPAAGGLLVYTAHAAYRRARPRAATTREPVHPHRPVPPTDPDRGVPLPDGHAARDHTGATAEYGDELAAMNAATRDAGPPLDGIELDWYHRISRYEALAAAAYETCAIHLDAALAAFVGAHRAGTFDLPPIVLPEVEPLPSIGIALTHLRGGNREPACAYRPAVTDTSEWDATALWARIDAEDRKLVTA